MNGKVYSKYPDMLLDSFSGMNKDYSKVIKSVSSIKRVFFRIYIAIFGIPEIGFQIRYLNFLKNLRKTKLPDSPKILDAGSGTGFYLYELSKLFNNSKITGYEIDSIKLKFTQKYFIEIIEKDVVTEKLYLEKMNDKNKFDLILNIDVLEHVENYQLVLKNLYNALKKGGHLYIHTPSIDQKRLFGKFFKNWEHAEHVREGFDKSIFEKDLKNLGFRIIASEYSHGFWGKLAWELNHILLKKSLILAAVSFPVLYVLALIDVKLENKKGLCLSVLAKK